MSSKVHQICSCTIIAENSMEGPFWTFLLLKDLIIKQNHQHSPYWVCILKKKKLASYRGIYITMVVVQNSMETI